MLYTNFKVASGYGTQYHNQLIPKNALYCRVSKNIYVYVSDFKLYNRTITCNKQKVNQTFFKIYTMDVRKKIQFTPGLCVEGSTLYDELWGALEEFEHWDKQVEYCCQFKKDKFNSCIRNSKTRPFRYKSSRTNSGEIPLEFHEAIMAHVYVTKNMTRSMPHNI